MHRCIRAAEVWRCRTISSNNVYPARSTNPWIYWLLATGQNGPRDWTGLDGGWRRKAAYWGWQRNGSHWRAGHWKYISGWLLSGTTMTIINEAFWHERFMHSRFRFEINSIVLLSTVSKSMIHLLHSFVLDKSCPENSLFFFNFMKRFCSLCDLRHFPIAAKPYHLTASRRTKIHFDGDMNWWDKLCKGAGENYVSAQATIPYRLLT